jgi:hypothetical protein
LGAGIARLRQALGKARRPQNIDTSIDTEHGALQFTRENMALIAQGSVHAFDSR